MGPQLTEADRQLIQRVGRSHNLCIQILNEEDNMCDTSVDINGTHTVELLPDVTDGKPFLVTHVTLIPGTRYHSDGSGTPDDVDVAELDSYARFTEAFASAVSLAVHQAVFDHAESVREDLDIAAQEERIFS